MFENKLKLYYSISSVFTLLLFFLPTSIQASEVYYIHSDHLGSTSVVTDSSGEVVQSDYYYPFGSSRSPSTVHSSPITEHQFTSQISDEVETGIYYYNARYYNPQIAKFTQADRLKDGENRYVYVNNNPLVYTDPSGNKVIDNIETEDVNKLDIVYKNFNFPYMAQPGWSTCAPTSLTMIFASYYTKKGISYNIDNLYEYFMDEFNLKGDGWDVNIKTIPSKVNNSLFLKADLDWYGKKKINSPLGLENFVEKNGSFIAHIRMDYSNVDFNNEPNHYVVVDGIAEIEGVTYVIVRDPFRSIELAKRELLPKMISFPNGAIGVEYNTFRKSWGGALITFEEKTFLKTAATNDLWKIE